MARVCRRTGWSWEYVDETLDMTRLRALEEDWADEPPTHVLVAAFLGVESGDRRVRSSGKKPTQSDAEELLRMFPGGNIK